MTDFKLVDKRLEELLPESFFRKGIHFSILTNLGTKLKQFIHSEIEKAEKKAEEQGFLKAMASIYTSDVAKQIEKQARIEGARELRTILFKLHNVPIHLLDLGLSELEAEQEVTNDKNKSKS